MFSDLWPDDGVSLSPSDEEQLDSDVECIVRGPRSHRVIAATIHDVIGRPRPDSDAMQASLKRLIDAGILARVSPHVVTAGPESRWSLGLRQTRKGGRPLSAPRL